MKRTTIRRMVVAMLAAASFLFARLLLGTWPALLAIGWRFSSRR